MSAFRGLPRTVWVLGFVSLANDLAADMVSPLIPILLTSVLAAGPMALGTVEGIANAVAAFVRLWAGNLSDRLGGRRKPFIVVGYLVPALTRPLLALSGSWIMVAVLRAIDRLGKGIRSAPRDAAIADATPTQQRSAAFSLHMLLDNVGAVGAALVAAAIVAFGNATVVQVIALSAIPSVLAVALAAFGYREAPHVAPPREAPELRLTTLPHGPLRNLLAAIGVFTFARVTETFLILRGTELGMSVVALLILWAAYSLAKAVSSYVGGRISHAIGPGPFVVAGWSVFALGFAALALASTPTQWVVAAIVFGLFGGAVEGVERALVSELAAAEAKGTAFGWYYFIVGIASIPAGALFGWIWQREGSSTSFGYGAIVALVAAGMVAIALARTKSMRPAR